jgi:hypothetical protein
MWMPARCASFEACACACASSGTMGGLWNCITRTNAQPGGAAMKQLEAGDRVRPLLALAAICDGATRTEADIERGRGGRPSACGTALLKPSTWRWSGFSCDGVSALSRESLHNPSLHQLRTIARVYIRLDVDMDLAARVRPPAYRMRGMSRSPNLRGSYNGSPNEHFYSFSR